MHALPDMVGVIFGDAVHNLRAALDFIAYDLIVQNGGSKKFTGFPFHKESGNYETEIATGKISVVPDKLKDVFRRVEAYSGGTGDLLWRMNKLDIIDKHRMLLASEFITGLRFGGSIPGLGTLRGRLSNRDPNGYLIISAEPLVPDQETALAFEVVIAERSYLTDLALIPTLRKMKDDTTAVLERFEAALAGSH